MVTPHTNAGKSASFVNASASFVASLIILFPVSRLSSGVRNVVLLFDIKTHFINSYAVHAQFYNLAAPLSLIFIMTNYT